MENIIKELASQIKAVVKEVKKTRIAMTQGGKYKLKRCAFQSLDEKGMLEPDAVANEFALIQQKKSSLSANERSVINQIVYVAMKLAAKEKMREKETAENSKQETLKLKKPRTRKKSETKTK